jgi:hypothetical protein
VEHRRASESREGESTGSAERREGREVEERRGTSRLESCHHEQEVSSALYLLSPVEDFPETVATATHETRIRQMKPFPAFQ